MSDFGDQLRDKLAQQEDAARAAGRRQEQERQAAEKQFEEAEAAAAALIEDVFGPLLAEFQEVMKAEGLFSSRRGRIRHERPARHRPDFGRQRVTCRAHGTARGRPVYEVRVQAGLGRASPLAMEFSAECVLCPPSQPPQSLVELPRSSGPAPAIDAAAARQWCGDILKQCAEALMRANFAPGPAPLHAPLPSMPAMAPIAFPATV
jgi:hypothetical protein